MRIIGAQFYRLQQWLLATGLVLASLLLIRFAWDFSAGIPAWLASPFWLLVAATLSVIALNIFLSRRDNSPVAKKREGNLLIGLIPVAFLASSLDCTGLSLRGCVPFCTFIKIGWIPLMAIVCAAYLFSMRSRAPVVKADSESCRKEKNGALLLFVLTLMAFVPLVPHCICDNAGNRWWIERLGASPTCYAWGFAATLVSISSLRLEQRARVSLLVCLAIIGGALGFFITHHFFHFPW